LATGNEEFAILECAWDDSGFLGEFRAGLFDRAKAEEYVAALEAIPEPKGETIPRDLVRIIWFVPQFMEWQHERAIGRNADPTILNVYTERVRTEVMRILGAP
jgi:hypothetical protein